MAVQLLLSGVASRIGLKQYVAFLCCLHLAFSPRVLLTFMRCIQIVVLTQPQVEKKIWLYFIR